MATSSKTILAGLVIIAIAVFGGLWVVANHGLGSLSLSVQGAGSNSGSGNVGGFTSGNCPTNGQTTFTVADRNGADGTASTLINLTGYLVGDKGSFVVTSASDGTAASQFTINCGEKYTLKYVSSDGNRGKNAYITSIDIGAGALTNGDGTVSFTPSAATYYLKTVSSMHGVDQFRVTNVNGNGWRYNTSIGNPGGNNNGFQFSSAIFNGTTSENSTVSITSTDVLDDKIYFKTNESVTDMSDFGYFIMIGAATSKWNVPTVQLNGNTLRVSSLNYDEQRQFGTTYQYYYKVTGSAGSSQNVAEVLAQPVPGVNPTEADSPTFAIVPIGAYLSVDGKTIKIAAAKDDSSATKVFTPQVITLGIS